MNERGKDTTTRYRNKKSARFAIYHVAPSQLYVRLFRQYMLNTNEALARSTRYRTKRRALSVIVDIVIKPLGPLRHQSDLGKLVAMKNDISHRNNTVITDRANYTAHNRNLCEGHE